MPKSKTNLLEQTISVNISVDRDADFRRLLELCAVIFNRHVDYSIDNDTTNKTSINTALYAQCRQDFPDVPSAFIQAMRDTAIESVTAWKTHTAEAIRVNLRRAAQNAERAKQCKPPKKFRKLPRRPRKSLTSAIRYDSRTFTKRGDQLTLSTIGKREQIVLQLSDYQRRLTDSPDWRLQSATVGYARRIGRGKSAKPTDQLVVNLTYTTPAPPTTTEFDQLVGADAGTINQLTFDDGTIFTSQQKRASQRQYLFTRKTLQAKGTRSAKKRLKKRSGREQRFSLDVDRCLAKVVSVLPFVVLALESLTGISTNRGRGKHGNKRLSSWSFARLVKCLQEACRKVGKQVVLVDPAFTSQQCSACGHIDEDNRNCGRFKCLECGFEAHADVNAAINIRRRAIVLLEKLAAGKSKAAQTAQQLFEQLDTSVEAHQKLVLAADRRLRVVKSNQHAECVLSSVTNRCAATPGRKNSGRSTGRQVAVNQPHVAAQ